MKKISSKKSVSASALSRVPLKFQFLNAASVRASGSFNNWDPIGAALNAAGDGFWTIDFELPPGRYEYRLNVDGEWIDVPGRAKRRKIRSAAATQCSWLARRLDFVDRPRARLVRPHTWKRSSQSNPNSNERLRFHAT